jgi:hypothetical protein
MGSVSRGMVVAVLISVTTTTAQAASEVDVGGFHDRVLESARGELLESPESMPQLRIGTSPAPSSALTGFTPRLGGLGLAIAGRRHSEPNLLVEEGPPSDRLQLGLSDTAHIAGWELGLAATADVGRNAAAAGDDDSTLVVGGQLAVSGLRVDAAVGQDSTLLGESGRHVTAGVGYDFGRIDTRMSYSVVETEERAATTGLLTLGSQLELGSNLSLQGDLAIADQENGDSTTAGRVSLRLNF